MPAIAFCRHSATATTFCLDCLHEALDLREKKAREEERERCAKLAEEVGRAGGMASEAARQIREYLSQ